MVCLLKLFPVREWVFVGIEPAAFFDELEVLVRNAGYVRNRIAVLVFTAGAPADRVTHWHLTRAEYAE